MSRAIQQFELLKNSALEFMGKMERMPWALADQALISVTNFVTIIFLAREFSQEAFGEFALVYSALLFANSIQSGIVTQPHNILGVTRTGREYQVYTTSTFLSQLILAGIAALLTLLAWGTAKLAGWGIAPMLLALAPAIVAWQFQELVRRVLYTEGREGKALVTDAVGYGGQILAIGALVWSGHLSGAWAFYAICLTSVAATLYGLWEIRTSLCRQVDWEMVLKNWHFGKWIAGGEIVGHWLSAQLFVYMAAGVLGAAAAAILRTVHTVFGPCRVLADVLCTVLPIRFSRTFAARGKAGLHAQLILSYAVAVPVLGGYCLLVALFAKPVLRLLYHDRYASCAPVLVLYSLAAFTSYMMMIVAAALRARRMTRELFDGQLYASLIALPIGWVLIRTLGVPGTALATLVTYVAMILLLWRSYQKSSSEETIEQPGSAALLRRVLALLDEAAIPFCITHGYEAYPDAVRSDVDCVMPADLVRNKLASLLNGNRAFLKAQIVQWVHDDTYYIVLMGREDDGTICQLRLDISTDYALNDRLFLKGREVLESRRRHGEFWIPSPEVEFVCCLLRRIVKGRMDNRHASRLSALYNQNPEGCAQQARRFVSARTADVIGHCAQTGEWDTVRNRLDAFRAELLRTAAASQPLGFVFRKLVRTARRVRRHLRPRHGLHVALLGPDGAGKSTVARSLLVDFAPAFFSTAPRSFPPGLLNRGSLDANSRPHAAAPRSYLTSSIRAVGYWLVYYSPGYLLTVYRDLGRGRLVLHDRHLFDAMVDPKRYRYAGPGRLLRLICRLVPQPDLTIILDAPPEVIQSRKQEVEPEETARQCLAYQVLSRSLSSARLVDAACSSAKCTAAVEDLILNHLSQRVQRQLGLEAELARYDDVRTVLRSGRGSEPSPSLIRQIGAGDQAYIYRASTRETGAGEPAHDVVIKLFRPDRPEVAMAAAEEFESLRRLQELLHDVVIEGWRILTPMPVGRCERPVAVVMDWVPGEPLQSLLASDEIAGDLGGIGRALAGALQRYWKMDGRIYGDFNLDNVLCDPKRRCISVVDPGMPERSFACTTAPRRWYPASRDLAYILFDTASSLRASLWNRLLRKQQRALVLGLFKANLDRIAMIAGKSAFIAEVDACCRVHLRRIPTSWSPLALRHWIVREVAAIRMRRLLAEFTVPGSAPEDRLRVTGLMSRRVGAR